MSANTPAVPATQPAVQLVGPDELTLNTAKPTYEVGPTQILAKVEAVGLCFSDLKLLKQFDKHSRKGPVVSGVPRDVLDALPSYVPGEKPTVPGHEACVRVVAVGPEVKEHKVGERYLVQADWRQAICGVTNGAFGYCFEGALQQYVLMDERIVIDAANGAHYLVGVQEQRAAAAVALVEPWACVECSYATAERRTVKAGGRLLMVCAAPSCIEGLAESFSPDGPPAHITAVVDDAQKRRLTDLGLKFTAHECLCEIGRDEQFDDVIYFGHSAASIEAAAAFLGKGGVMNIVLGGETIGEPVSVDVGAVHYGGTRWIGAAGGSAAEAYEHIPKDGEIRPGDRVLVVGAGGPMGQMHVIRAVSMAAEGVSVVGTDFDAPRLEALHAKAAPVAERNGVPLSLVNPKETPVEGAFGYIAIMVPVAPLVARAVRDAEPGGLVNIFAGIPAGTKQELDLDAYIERKLFMFGTSGSRIEDMLAVRDKMQADQLDTNLSVDAVCGMAGAIDGIRAVEDRSIAGKIICYPQLLELPLTPLTELGESLPSVAEKLDNGAWTAAAEEELLRTAK